MVTSRHETHFDGIIFDFLLPGKLAFYSHLGDVVDRGGATGGVWGGWNTPPLVTNSANR